MRSRWGLIIVIAAGLPAAADAAITAISADITSEVRLFSGGSAGPSDLGSGFFDSEIELPLPIVASAAQDGSSPNDAGGVANSDFRDPTLSILRNPQEIGIEADVFSNDSSSRLEAKSTVIERREIVFRSGEFNAPVGATRTARSAIFPSGAIFLWSLDGQLDLSGVSGEVTFVVRRIRPARPEDETEEEVVEEELLRERVALVGGAGGAVTVETTEGIVVLEGGLEVLPGAGSLPAEFSSIDVARVAVVLGQQVNYDYEIVIGEEFDLIATFEVAVQNVPGGTGVAAVFGRGFQNFEALLTRALPGQSATRLVSSVNTAIREQSNSGARQSGSFNFCGVLGMEMLTMMGLGGVGLRYHSRRRRATSCWNVT